MEVIESPRLLRVHRPSLRSLQACRQGDCPVQLQFRVEIETVTVPDGIRQAAEDLADFGNAASHFIVNFGVAGKRGAQIGFRQIQEGTIPVGPHLLTLPLKLAGGEDHDGGPTMTAEAASAIREMTLFQMVAQAIEDASKDPRGDFQQRDASTVIRELSINFPLVEMDDCGVLEILRDFSLTLHLLE
ncbi:hypothetical protein SprV_0301096500 [Sparganum proliferum]